MPDLDVRPEVAAFALAMEERLRANDHKNGWQRSNLRYLFKRLLEEAEELREASGTWCPTCGHAPQQHEKNEIRHEAADVGNFAMMIADRLGALSAPSPTDVAPVDLRAALNVPFTFNRNRAAKCYACERVSDRLTTVATCNEHDPRHRNPTLAAALTEWTLAVQAYRAKPEYDPAADDRLKAAEEYLLAAVKT